MIKTKENGFSLVEVMIALTMLMSLVAFFSYFGNRKYQSVQSSMDSHCLSIANELMDQIKGIGYEKSMVGHTTPTGPTGVGFNWNIPRDSINHLPTGAQRQLNEEAIQVSGGTYRLSTYKGVVGIMSFLNDIYGANYPTVCQNPLGVTLTPSVLRNTFSLTGNVRDDATADNKLRNLNHQIRIATYPVNNPSITADCSMAGNRRIRPMGETNNPDGSIGISTQTSNVIVDPLSVADRGFFVTVNTSYRDQLNVQKTCFVSHHFRYPVQRVNASLNSASATINIAHNAAACSPQGGTGTLTLNFPAGFDTQRNMFAMCRDISQQTMSPTSKCTATHPADPVPQAFTTPNTWVPCTQVTLCGLPATSVNRSGATFTQTYANIPWGCRGEVQVRLVDPALNITQFSATSGSHAVVDSYRVCNTCTYSPPTVTYCGAGPGVCPPPPPPPPTDGQDGTDGGHDGGDGGGSHDGNDGGW